MAENEKWFDYSDDADGLKPSPAVTFNMANANALKDAANAAAAALDGQASTREGYRATGASEFQGYYADLFSQNGGMQQADWTNLSAALRAVSTDVTSLIDAVNAENKRRADGNAEIAKIRKANEDANIVEKALGIKQVASVPATHDSGPAKAVPVEESSPRQALDGQGGSGGTSAAVPDNLRAFASGNQSADQELTSPFNAFAQAYASFSALKGAWGTVDASGVVMACSTYIQHNGDEARWADTVATLFEQAGASGSVVSMSNAAIDAALSRAGVSNVRSVIDIENPSIIGAKPSSGFADDPVNTATGNFIEPCVDLTLQGGGAGLSFTRCYNSLARNNAAFGRGWHSWTESCLVLGERRATWVHEDGRHTVFTRDLDGAWQRSAHESYWLVEDADTGNLHVTNHRMGVWRFDARGRLLEMSQGKGTRMAFHYDASGRLADMEHERGRRITLTWDDGLKRVTGLESDDGRRVAYRYDDDGMLLRVEGAVPAHTYEYDQEGLLTTVKDADGVPEVVNTYNDNGQVLTQHSAFGRTSHYAYLPGGVTQVADGDGSRANIWVSDEQGRLTAVTDSDGNTQRTSYDRWGNPIRIVDRLGHSTIRAYDHYGRISRELQANGADTSYEYDVQGRVIRVKAGEACTTYEYASEDDANPSLLTDPVGGRTCLTWDDGLLTSVTDPVGVTLDLSYDDQGDVVAVSNADGDMLSFTRDEAGRLSSMSTPSGARTTYSYNELGLLISVTAPDGGTWRYEYTQAGRQRVCTNPLGEVTSLQYGEHGQPIARTDPLGRVSTRKLDDLGNLASITTPGGDTWQYGFDALSRLRTTTDPQGGIWKREYDQDGNPAMVVDPTGVSQTTRRNDTERSISVDDGLMTTTLTYDRFGRVIRQHNPDGSREQLVYDLAGRVVEILDENAGLTLIHRDLAGKVVERLSPTGLRTSYAYDACGRLSGITGPDGRTEHRYYDADSRLIRHILSDGSVAECAYDACGRITSLTRPGMPACSYRYDKAGQLVHAEDEWGARTFTYDKAGQLTTIMNALGGVNRYAYDEDGRLTKSTSPLGNESRYEWNALNNLVTSVDPLGRVIRADYDGAGRQRSQHNPDGRLYAWQYDRSGREQSLTIDGDLAVSSSRDLLGRTLSLCDGEASHEVLTRYDALGHTIGRTTDDSTMTWGYDSEGRRTSMTTGDGEHVTYTYSEGRLQSIDHSGFGHVVVEYDGQGRVARLLSGELLQSWEYDGQSQVIRHTLTDDTGVHVTDIQRDRDSRVVAVTRDGALTSYEYDRAGQLVRLRDERGVSTWQYDAAGRLTASSDHGDDTRYTYDAAGQLVQEEHGDGALVTYAYDPMGRRISRSGAVGSREYTYDARGYLSRIRVGRDDEGEDLGLHVDVAGLLDSVNGQPVRWDSAGALPVLTGIASTPVASLGLVTGIDGRWVAPGYRAARADSEDPWQSGGAVTVRGLPDGVSLDAAGTVSVDKLAWMGARVYDPATMGFLSRDPLPGDPGSVWASNPYEYAANNPLMFSDPLGLKPLTDEQLQERNRSWWNNIGGVLNSGWNGVSAGFSKTVDFLFGYNISTGEDRGEIVGPSGSYTKFSSRTKSSDSGVFQFNLDNNWPGLTIDLGIAKMSVNTAGGNLSVAANIGPSDWNAGLKAGIGADGLDLSANAGNAVNSNSVGFKTSADWNHGLLAGYTSATTVQQLDGGVSQVTTVTGGQKFFNGNQALATVAILGLAAAFVAVTPLDLTGIGEGIQVTLAGLMGGLAAGM